MKLREIKPLSEWHKVGRLGNLSPDQIETLEKDANLSNFSIDENLIVKLLDAGNQLIYFVVEKTTKKVVAYSIFEKVFDDYFKQDNFWTDQNFRKRGIQVNLMTYILHEKSITICNGDGLTRDSEDFWLKFKDLEKANNNYSQFYCFVFDFQKREKIAIKDLKDNQFPEGDTSNRYRYCVSLKDKVEEQWLVGPLYQSSKFKVLREAKLRAWLDFVPRGLEGQVD